MSKSFEQIFSESNPHGFGGYEGPCTCCKPKSTDKVTKAYARGVQDEQERIIKLLEHERNAANEQTMIWNILNGAIALIKGENR